LRAAAARRVLLRSLTTIVPDDARLYVADLAPDPMARRGGGQDEGQEDRDDEVPHPGMHHRAVAAANPCT
jgi:hypothetical protein